MKRQQKVMGALNFDPSMGIPRDLGGMRSTGISAFAYPHLVKALGLPPRLPKVHDTYQMLALPDLDVLDALNCDVVVIDNGITNAFDQSELWHPYDFNGRLPALVQNPDRFSNQSDGSVLQEQTIMPVSANVFDDLHGGQPLLMDEDPPLMDLKTLKRELIEKTLSDQAIFSTRDLCKKVRQSTDRAIFYSGEINAGIGIGAWGGLGIFPVICITEEDYVYDLHTIMTDAVIAKIRKLLPAIKDNIDIIMLSADDWGTQKSTIASPETFRTLFKPFYKKIIEECHTIAPHVKIFLHSCGAIYHIIDDIIDCGFDVLNPVQWVAGDHDYQAWKQKCDGKIALWGGAVNAQKTLNFGSATDVAQEAERVVQCLSKNGGYVFNSIHNILAEIKAENILALYHTAEKLEALRD